MESASWFNEIDGLDCCDSNDDEVKMITKIASNIFIALL
jgi:hypothetical protein